MRRLVAISLLVALTGGVTLTTQTAKAGELDRLLAPVALYPDQLLAQMLLCASNPGKLAALGEWLASNEALSGSALQDAAVAAGFEPSFVALVPFPSVVHSMTEQLEWTTKVGQAFAADRSVVFASIQRLRTKARDAGKLKSTPQQDVETRTTSSGQQVIVIEPANPQIVYVPQYNPQVVYTQAAPTTVVIEDDDSDEAVAAGLIGFTAGIAIGAAIDNDYYYGPYGWHGGAYMYNDAWDDWYDDREDAREDWYDARDDARDDWQENREDLAGERTDRAQTQQEQRTERRQTQQQERTERTQARQDNRPQAQTQSATQEARGYSRGGATAASERSGTRSDAFSGYASGRSEQRASQRGQQSRSASRSGGSRRR
jgi:hypothetical protein